MELNIGRTEKAAAMFSIRVIVLTHLPNFCESMENVVFYYKKWSKRILEDVQYQSHAYMLLGAVVKGLKLFPRKILKHFEHGKAKKSA